MVRLVLLTSLATTVKAANRGCNSNIDGGAACTAGAADSTACVTWTKGGTWATTTAGTATAYCGSAQGTSHTGWGDLLPWNAALGTTNANDADGCGTAAANFCGENVATRDKCCQIPCSFATWQSGSTGTEAAASGSTKPIRNCGTDKVPLAAATLADTGVGIYTGTSGANENSITASQAGTCCQDACKKTASGSQVNYLAGAGTDASPNFYCGAGRIPVANQASTPSGATSNTGNRKTTCCNDACGKVSFKAGEGTDDSAATTPVYYCGLDKVPNANQDSLDSTSDAVGASQKTTCCSDACGKVTFKAGDGTDDSSATTYYCGENKVPVKKQAEVPSGSNSVGSGQKSTCCDDACGKVTFKAGKGTDDSASTTYYCGENKVPVAKQKDAPSGSDSVGSGQKSKCCAAACSTVTYKAGEGTDKDTTYFCGKNKSPKKDQKTLPCDGSSCSASGKKDCCAATCASTKWAAGKKPKSPASKTMYCGDGMSPKSALADTVCAGDECVEATDAGTCCEKKKVNNTTATTDAYATGGSVLLLTGALVLAIQ